MKCSGKTNWHVVRPENSSKRQTTESTKWRRKKVKDGKWREEWREQKEYFTAD